jgi:hypothetical protein
MHGANQECTRTHTRRSCTGEKHGSRFTFTLPAVLARRSRGSRRSSMSEHPFVGDAASETVYPARVPPLHALPSPATSHASGGEAASETVCPVRAPGIYDAAPPPHAPASTDLSSGITCPVTRESGRSSSCATEACFKLADMPDDAAGLQVPWCHAPSLSLPPSLPLSFPLSHSLPPSLLSSLPLTHSLPPSLSLPSFLPPSPSFPPSHSLTLWRRAWPFVFVCWNEYVRTYIQIWIHTYRSCRSYIRAHTYTHTYIHTYA